MKKYRIRKFSPLWWTGTVLAGSLIVGGWWSALCMFVSAPV